MRTSINIALVLVALLFISCSPSTPQSRISENPELYSSLSAEHQKLVAKGEIAKDMTKPAVFLAWGVAQQKSQGFKNQQGFEKWSYFISRPSYVNSYGARIGYSRYHDRWGCNGYSSFSSPQFVYQDSVYATVVFKNGLVRDWEKDLNR